MPKIIKNGKEYSGVPIEVVTAWAPTADPVQVKEPLMGNTDISDIGDGTVTGAIDTVNTGLTNCTNLADNVIAGTVTPLTGGRNAMLVRQVGHVVAIWGFMDGLSISANTQLTFAQISGVSLPADHVRVRGAVGSNAYSPGNDAYIIVDTNGKISVTSSGAGNTVYFNAVYIR